MYSTERFVIRRCDAFYRFWYDVSGQLSFVQAQEIYDRLTSRGTRCSTPDDIDYYDIFPANPLPEWPDTGRPLIRRLCSHDRKAIEAHLLGLNEADRRLRFFNAASDDQIRGYVRNIDWHCSVLLGAVFCDAVVGMSEALFDGRGPVRHAEIAVSVDRLLRRRGLGCFLVRHVIGRAALHGVDQTSLRFLRENQPIPRMVRRLGGTVDMEDLVGVVPVEPGTGFDIRLATS